MKNGKFTTTYWLALGAVLVGGYYILKPAPSVAAPAPATSVADMVNAGADTTSFALPTFIQ